MAAEKTGTVNAPAGLRLRQSPDTNAAVLDTLKQGTEVIILAGEGTIWLNVRVKTTSQIGYLFAQYVTISVPVLETPGVPVTMRPGFLGGEPALFTTPLVPTRLITLPTDNVGKTVTGIWNRFGGLFGVLANRLSIPVGVVVAVLAAESGGRTGDTNGRMIIRFENHIFWTLWGKSNADTFNRFFNFNRSGQTWTGHQFRANEGLPFTDFHGNQDKEWDVLTFARRLNDTAALSSISMGAPQVMGFNFGRLGYNSVQDMFTAFNASPRSQLIAIFDFVRGGPAITALQAGDYLQFATSYNGSGNAQTYANIINSYNARFTQLLTP